ncbi:MAG: DsbA family protein [Pseudomonadota bacterium]
MATSRRDLLIIGAAVAVVIGIRQVWLAEPQEFDFRPLKSPEGFRLLKSGPLSGGDGVLLGIDLPDQATQALKEDLRQNLRQTLFGQGTQSAVLPTAVFSDYNCPYCRQISAHMQKVSAQDPEISVAWHDLAFLGPSSTRAALAAYAAQIQDLHLAAHDVLMRQLLRPGPAALRKLAGEIGADPQQLAQDTRGPEAQLRLDKAHALASVMGVVGTPVTVVGKTIVYGSIGLPALDQLIVLEKSEI